jgi:hypothetical protein
LNIEINGRKLDFQTEQEQNLGEILGAIENECEKSGMTVTGIKADGRNVPADELDAFFALEPNAVGLIELSTISGSDVRAMLGDLGTRFTECCPALIEIPVLLQTGKDLKAMEIINACSSNLHNLYQILPLLAIAGIPGEGPDIDGTALGQYPSVLSPVLRDLLDALEKKDTILVGDLSEYELAPKIEKLGTVLATLT